MDYKSGTLESAAPRRLKGLGHFATDTVVGNAFVFGMIGAAAGITGALNAPYMNISKDNIRENMKRVVFDVRPEARKDHPVAYYALKGGSYAARYVYYVEKGAFEATNLVVEHFQVPKNNKQE